MTEAGEAAVETGALPVEPTFARLLSTSLVFVLGAVASKVVGLVLLPILTRELTPAGYGETDVLLALSTALTAALTLGLDVVLLRLWFDQPDRRARRSLVSTAYVIALAATVIAGCIILAFSSVITTAMTGDANLEPAVRLLAVVVVAGVILTINQTVLRAQERAGAFAIINGGALITYAVLAVILLTNWRSDANAVMVAWATSLVVFTAIGLLLVRAEAFGRPKIDRGQELLRLSLPLAPAVAIALVGEFVNRAILLSAAGAPNVAYFTVAGRIAAVAGLAVAGFQLAWLPRAYGFGTSEEARRRLAADSLWIVGIVCTMALGIAVMAPGVLPLITGPGYADALPVLGFSLLTVIGMGLYLVASLPSAMAKATHDLGLAIGAGVLVGVALNLVLVHLWQSVGTAAAVAVGQFLSVVIVTRLGFWRVPLPVNLAKIGGMTIITGLVVLADLVGGLVLPARILLGAIALGLIAWSVPWRAAVRQVRDRQPGRTGKEPGR